METKTPTEFKRRENVNREITAHDAYYPSLYHAHTHIDSILLKHGFKPMADGIYCGDGRAHEQVGENTWVVFQWYRMPSGQVEITAYVG